MYTPIQQNVIDQKIHNFMAKKSPARTFSKTLAERLTPSFKSKRSALTEISYEPLEWHQTDSLARTSWQNAQ